jgi:hypothetical protein
MKMSKKSQAAMESALLQEQKPWGKIASIKLTDTKKSQAAMEFLMTYGWALLVVLVVIAALAVFGMLNPGKYLPAKCDIAPGIQCLTYGATTDKESISTGDNDADIVTIVAKNGLGLPITNATLYVTKCTNTDNFKQVYYIPEGESGVFKIRCAGLVPSGRFRSDLKIYYNVSAEDTSTMHYSKGQLIVDVASIIA